MNTNPAKHKGAQGQNIPAAVRLIVIRHGETDHNKQGRYMGRTDIPLNAKGKEQALLTAQKMKEMPVHAVITSPLARARETADIIGKECSLPVSSDAAFIERNLGIFEELTKKEVQTRYPELYSRTITRIFDEAPPGGETINEVFQRVSAGLNQIRKEHSGKTIILVTHAFTAKAINRFFHPGISDSEFFAFSLPLGGTATYAFGELETPRTQGA